MKHFVASQVSLVTCGKEVISCINVRTFSLIQGDCPWSRSFKTRPITSLQFLAIIYRGACPNKEPQRRKSCLSFVEVCFCAGRLNVTSYGSRSILSLQFQLAISRSRACNFKISSNQLWFCSNFCYQYPAQHYIVLASMHLCVYSRGNRCNSGSLPNCLILANSSKYIYLQLFASGDLILLDYLNYCMIWK